MPTLVEVKRSSDTRIRREVVGQLLEYAANGTRYWPVEQLRGLFEAGCRERGADPDVALLESFGDEIDVEAWWAQVADNLSHGRLRLVFVADEISRELRRIIEFLNEQMTQTEVLGVEIRQYVDEGGEHQTLVPRLVGQTERARTTKGGGRRRAGEWDMPTLLAEIATHGDQALEGAKALFGWAEPHPAVSVDFGKGATNGTATFRLQGGAVLTAFRLWSDGGLQIPFSFMGDQPPFGASREARDELRRRISEALPDKNLRPEEETTNPGFKVPLLADSAVFDGFIAAIEWAFEQARAAQQATTGDSELNPLG